MKQQLEMLEEFQQAFGHPVNRPDVLISNAGRDFINLRIRLHGEENRELADELWTCYGNQKISPNLLKEGVDLLYVVLGTYVSLGLGDALIEAFKRVHESNMSKLGDDGNPIRREDGKTLKGPNYKEPNLSDLV